jgi:hypothetical protein
MYVSPTGSTVRLSQTPGNNSVPLSGVDRLRILADVARYATELEVYASSDGATAWRLETPDARFFLVLSPEPSRGFSGEGQVLEALSKGSKMTARLRALLRWQQALDPGSLASELDASESEIAASLGQLATAGLVGYDLAEAKYFHRELPFDPARVETRHPRLVAARELVRAEQVEIDADESSAWVRGKQGEYRMCPWIARHGTSRGPCKHILAVQIVAGEPGQ